MHFPEPHFSGSSAALSSVGLSEISITTESPTMRLASGYSPENAMFDLPDPPLWIVIISLLLFSAGVVLTILIYLINAPVRSNKWSSFTVALGYVKSTIRARKRGDNEEEYELLWSAQGHRRPKDHDEEESIESDGDAGSTTALDYQSPRIAAAAKLTPRLGFRSEPLDEATWIQARAAFDEQAVTPRSEKFYYQLGSESGSSTSSRDRVGNSQQDGGVVWSVMMHLTTWPCKVEELMDYISAVIARLSDDDAGEDGLLLPIEEVERLQPVESLKSIV